MVDCDNLCDLNQGQKDSGLYFLCTTEADLPVGVKDVDMEDMNLQTDALHKLYRRTC